MNALLLGGAALLLMLRKRARQAEDGVSPQDLADELSEEVRERWAETRDAIDVLDAEGEVEPLEGDGSVAPARRKQRKKKKRRRRARQEVAPPPEPERRDREAELEDVDAAAEARAAALEALRREGDDVDDSGPSEPEPPPSAPEVVPDEPIPPQLLAEADEDDEDDVAEADEVRPGVDMAQARRLAPRVAADIRDNRYDYSRRELRAFQAAAGIAVDGVYGGGSAGALRYYLDGPPPRPLFKPTTEREYSPWME